MTPIIAELPDSGWLLVGCLVLALAGLVGVGAILRFARQFRSDLAEELRREIKAKGEATQVSVQQPLEVKAHVAFTTIDKHNALAKDMDELKEQRRKDVAGLHSKIEHGIDGVRKDIETEFKEVRGEMADRREDIATLKTETTTQTRQLHQLDGKIDRILERLPRS